VGKHTQLSPVSVRGSANPSECYVCLNARVPMCLLVGFLASASGHTISTILCAAETEDFCSNFCSSGTAVTHGLLYFESAMGGGSLHKC